MKRLVLLGILAGLTACGVVPVSRTVPLNVVAVDIPALLAPGADLSVTVKYSLGCNDKDQRLLLVKRTASILSLEASATNNGLPVACPAVYAEQTLTYVDSGAVGRTNPFEVVVNGKSWGKVEVK